MSSINLSIRYRMKKISTFVWMLFIASYLLAQAPESINYQAVARDGAGALLINQAVSFRISILQVDHSERSFYSESQNVTTNQLGWQICRSDREQSCQEFFSAIDWSSNIYYLQTEMDPAGVWNIN